MRSLMSKTVCLSLLALYAVAFPMSLVAHETKAPLEVVEELAVYVAAEGASFEGANPLYKAAKAAIAEEAAAIADEDARPAAKRYGEIRSQVADVMRRNELPTSAWLMGFFGATLLWGGMAFCIGVARKRGGGKGST